MLQQIHYLERFEQMNQSAGGGKQRKRIESLPYAGGGSPSGRRTGIITRLDGDVQVDLPGDEIGRR
jgi:hypothetical protein